VSPRPELRTGIPPIRRSNLVEDVTRAIRDAIARGLIKPGSHLVQDELAADLGVSRTPLRQALRILQEEGLVTAAIGRGVVVRLFNPAETAALYEVREVVDGLAARLACQRASARDRHGLHRTCDGMAASLEHRDDDEWLFWNLKFHEDLLHAAHNEILDRELPLVQMSARGFFPTVVTNPGRAHEAHREHMAVLAAIESGESESAERIARQHIATARRMVLQEVAGTTQRRRGNGQA
jgi:DNA-binding GntR family transcriptional regulator